jgi:SEC-C motif domain protein
LAQRCPCGSGETYAACCEPRHDGSVPAPTAETLMRSRFTAFALGDSAYLTATWLPTTRPRALELDPGRRWTRLDVLDTVDGGPFADTGEVEFTAHYRDGSVRGSQHERSRFVRQRGRWYYVDAVAHRAEAAE